MVAGAPKDMGVYALWRGDKLIYIGRALGEIVLQPIVRELELLQEHRDAAGELPPCNLHCA
jgi:hypothetical protein